MVVTFNLKFSEIIEVSFFFLLRFLNHKAYSLGLMQAYFFLYQLIDKYLRPRVIS